MKVITIVQIYKLFRIVIVIFVISYFLGIFWLIYVRDLQNWHEIPIDRFDVYQGYASFYSLDGSNWILPNGDPSPPGTTLGKIWYYALTTLSTIGFGDYSPKSVDEKMLGSIVLMIGVAVFSIIMNTLMDIMSDIRSLSEYGAPRDLSKWIAMLSKYNNGLPMSKDTISEIENFFDYYWTENKLNAFSTELDMRFMSELPESVSQIIYIDYLFKDFVYKFKYITVYETPKGYVKPRVDDLDFRQNVVNLIKGLEPRLFKLSADNDHIIQDQFTEVFELFFLVKGQIGVGYRIFNEVFLGMALKDRQMMNDYAMVNNKVSEFLYKPISEVIEGLALRREKFNELREEKFWSRCLPLWNMQYIDKIQKPILDHRAEMAKKFSNRIDYVDLSAFGVGIGNGKNFVEEIVDYDKLVDKYTGTGKLYNKLSNLNGIMDKFKFELRKLSKRYDKRIGNVLGEQKPKLDQFQKDLTRNLFQWE